MSVILSSAEQKAASIIGQAVAVQLDQLEQSYKTGAPSPTIQQFGEAIIFALHEAGFAVQERAA